jgi:hypothetical protein
MKFRTKLKPSVLEWKIRNISVAGHRRKSFGYLTYLMMIMEVDLVRDVLCFGKLSTMTPYEIFR